MRKLMLALFPLLALAGSAGAHIGTDHPGVDIAVTSVVRHADGHVTGWGWAVCPAGQDWSGGLHVNEGDDPSDGVARHEGAPIHITCDGEPHAWGPIRTDRLWDGGVKTDGTKRWQAKMQSPSPPALWIHKDTGHAGMVAVPLPGDVNRDGSVNGTDFALLASNFGRRSDPDWGRGDFNHDGAVDGTDFALLAGNFGRTAPGATAVGGPPSGAAAVAPEPAALCVLGLPLVLLGRAMARRPLSVPRGGGARADGDGPGHGGQAAPCARREGDRVGAPAAGHRGEGEAHVIGRTLGAELVVADAGVRAGQVAERGVGDEGRCRRGIRGNALV